jgi:hypothetical protein
MKKPLHIGRDVNITRDRITETSKPNRLRGVPPLDLSADLDAMPEIRLALIARIDKALASKKLPIGTLQLIALTIEGYKP